MACPLPYNLSFADSERTTDQGWANAVCAFPSVKLKSKILKTDESAMYKPFSLKFLSSVFKDAMAPKSCLSKRVIAFTWGTFCTKAGPAIPGSCAQTCELYSALDFRLTR